tara:strand:+ start:77 stop:1987 length:1911 start_codon:yes stop_codon:yes gene_type:complete
MDKILNTLFPEIDSELGIFDKKSVNQIKIYEKSEGKFYLKSLSIDEKEKLIYNKNSNKKYKEEIVRQLFLLDLFEKYKYPKKLVEIEKIVKFGREEKKADIVVFQNDGITPGIVIEAKSPDEDNDVDQLKSYLNAEGAPIGVGVNGLSKVILYRPYPKQFDDTLSDIPKYGETVDDLLKKKFKIKDLKFPTQLKKVIIETEELVLANSGFDSFDEIFKLLYAKFFDESEALLDPENYVLKFRKHQSKDVDKTKENIDLLFNQAKNKWSGVFSKSDIIRLRADHLSVCVSELESWRLLGANLKVIDEAFEYLIPAVAKSKKGQYFTPRNLIEMCVKILDPKKNEIIVDTACGSGGFLVHTMDHVNQVNNFNNRQKQDYSSRSIYGFDFDEKLSKIAQAMMLISGDGKSHIYKLNSLDLKDEEWTNVIKDLDSNNLLQEQKDYQGNLDNKKYGRYLNFDVLFANPPFSGTIKERKIISEYFLGKKKNKVLKKISRDILFIERNLNAVKPGGRIAMVLPQGIFNNKTLKHIRDYIINSARILGVISVNSNMFQPHTGTKVSIVFLKKWQKNNSDKSEDYNIFFSSSFKCGKLSSGDYLYKKNNQGELIYDQNQKLIIDDDFEEIINDFNKFLKKEKINF